MPDDPCPMWMNPITEVSLAKMGPGPFGEVRSKAKYAGVFIYRTVRLTRTQVNGLEMAQHFIQDSAPEGSFTEEVPWWVALGEMADDEMIEHKEWEDSYGEPYKRLPLAETAAACRKIWEEEEYRRALLAADVLDHFIEGIKMGIWREYNPSKDGIDPVGSIMLIHEGY